MSNGGPFGFGVLGTKGLTVTVNTTSFPNDQTVNSELLRDDLDLRMFHEELPFRAEDVELIGGTPVPEHLAPVEGIEQDAPRVRATFEQRQSPVTLRDLKRLEEIVRAWFRNASEPHGPPAKVKEILVSCG